VSKLLGTVFGMNLQAVDIIDTFLKEQVEKRLQYWSTAKLNTTRCGVIVNSVLLSGLIFFVLVWRGTQAGIKKIKAMLENYHWSGKSTTS
jgi:hypothetical protein